MSPRYLAQPGPPLEPRVIGLAGRVRPPLALVLEPGLSLLDAVARPLRAAGIGSAVLTLEGGGFGPFAYVLPAASPDAEHAAWYSATHAPAGGARLERGCITFGLRSGRPWLHCHGVWQEAAGRRGGHVLPEESRVAAPIRARAWGLDGMGFAVDADPETNFALFGPIAQPSTLAQPSPVPRPDPVPQPGNTGGNRAVAVRVRPNEDLPMALEAACAAQGFARAVLRGGLGSLVGARFTDGGRVADAATEFLVTGGEVGPAGARVAVALVGLDGRVAEGVLRRGDNPVCITFEGVLEEQG